LKSFFFNSQREYDHAKLERTKAEQERSRKEEELQKLKEIALKEQHDFNEKRLQTLVDDFLRMKALTVRIEKRKHYYKKNLFRFYKKIFLLGLMLYQNDVYKWAEQLH